ncbi:hypothetical protein [Marinitoga aeolica]|uniref:Lipoprotein n=1 Tax=Marinitoga aeolica TaxID=2809031 RepID=A0ABY8PPS8_9BACT|nr:hypothetical protein [Marinitoga aeolica]WGS64640.1 hypothetical protein JRV97_09775 [Marinitoga aeolica]
MKKILLFIISLIFVFSSCIKIIPKAEDTNFSDLTQDQKELLIRLIATGYNKGGNYKFDELKNLASTTDYDDRILNNYKYFIGITDVMPTKTIELKTIPNDDERIKEYIKSIINKFKDNGEYNNNSDDNFFIDAFNEYIPVNPLRKDRDFSYLNPKIKNNFMNEDELINRVYNLIYRDYNNNYIFKKWYDKYFGEDFLSSIKIYAKFLVDMAYTYTHSNAELNRINYTNSELYPEKISLNHIPVELLLSIMYQESKFFPASFKAEIKTDDENIEYIDSVSFGLTHTLIDSDYLYISKNYNDIGNNKFEPYNFSMISWYYLYGANPFNNPTGEETYFSDWDLITIRGSILYSTIYLDMLYQKLIKYIK